ncbi:MAG: hypothetical protein CME29_08400 [Gemmatimonadetes bacterium]|nr:hypothetical protein [Gemmatimonadota bacterium]|tara:strand:- start:116 stop:481 length:366 start_codon:yes stop_codon:yes gene_type:complete
MNFSANAFREISFLRTDDWESPLDDFHKKFTAFADHSLTAQTEGFVHSEVERELLLKLAENVRVLEDQLASEEVLLIDENYDLQSPKTKTIEKRILVNDEQKLYFYCSVYPSLRLVVFGAG